MMYLSPGESELGRLKALRRYAIVDTMAETAYDDLTRIASFIAEAPIALITLVDRDRLWFKSRLGFPEPEAVRDMSFCAHAILEPSSLFIVPDALADPRFCDNKLVTKTPGIRFYCGAPLVTWDNHALGTLCVIDHVPRTLSREQAEMLQALARQVMVLLEMRRLSQDLSEATQIQSNGVRRLGARRPQVSDA